MLLVNHKTLNNFNSGPDQIFIGNDADLSIYGVGSSSFVSPYDSWVNLQKITQFYMISFRQMSCQI